MDLIYRLGRHGTNFAVRQFFRRVSQKGEPLVEDGPLLLVANHQNCALDPLLVTSFFKRPLWYIAKATLFSLPPIGFFLRQAHLLPIQRRQDGPVNAEQNEATFDAVVSKLVGGQAVLIFPEGQSLGVRTLESLRTGAARMALLGESRKNFELGLRIQAIGLTYSDLDEFRSSVTAVVSAPLALSSFAEPYRENQIEAARSLTAAIEALLGTVVVEVDDEVVAEDIAKLYVLQGSKLDDHERFLIIARNLAALSPETRAAAMVLAQDIRECVNAHHSIERPGHNAIVLLSPFLIFGGLVNWLPYRLVGWTLARANPHPAWLGSMKLSLGLLVYPVFYAALAIGVALWVNWLGLAPLLWLFLLFLGLVTNQFYFSWLGAVRPCRMQWLQQWRERLISEIEKYRQLT